MSTPPSGSPHGADHVPGVTVIMPVRNEGPFIESALEAILSQDYPAERTRILVVDGRSDDDTRERVRRVARDHPTHRIELIDNPGRIAPCALNAGLAETDDEIVVRVDGHCEIGTSYVSNGVGHLLEESDHGVVGVGGVLETVGETPTARAIAVAMSSRFGVGGSAFRTADPAAPPRDVDTVAFPAYLRSALEEAGPFDEELVRNQDDEYNYRLRKAGHRILLVPDMPVRYYSRARLGALFRQYRQYGHWKVRVLQKHPKQMSLRQFVPPLFVVSLLGAAILALLGPTARPAVLWLAPAPGLAYLLANSIATLVEARRSSLPLSALPTLACAFALMHVGYGLGFLGGLIRFARRW